MEFKLTLLTVFIVTCIVIYFMSRGWYRYYNDHWILNQGTDRIEQIEDDIEQQINWYEAD